MEEHIILPPYLNPEVLNKVLEKLDSEEAEELRLYFAGLKEYERGVGKYVKDLEGRVLIDSLTGAYNRRKFDIDIKEFVKHVNSSYYSKQNLNFGKRTEDKEKDLSMLLIDLDHFKKINDTYGHQKGDDVLISTVDVIKESLRDEDKKDVYRYGGEEFSILLPDTTLEYGINIAKRVLKNISSNVILEKGKYVTASIGVANYKGNCNSLEELIRYSDRAMYKAKENGRNRVEVYNP